MPSFWKYGLVICLLCLSITSEASFSNDDHTCSVEQLEGKWQFFKYIYQDKIHPPMNPDLILQFEFFGNGQNRLYWTRKGQTNFCERRGVYIYNQCQLMDQVVWVNPENGPGCSRDQDMVVGRRTTTRVDFNDDLLHLYLRLGDEPFIYVWKRVESDEDAESNLSSTKTGK